MKKSICGLFGLACAMLPAGAVAEVTVAVAAFDYVDTSGEVKDQASAHAARLKGLTENIEQALRKTGRFAASPLACAAPPCSVKEMDQADMTAAAKAQHAQYLVFGGVHKMSTLIQWGRIEVMEVASGKRMLARTVTFRGDSDDAWQHAADYISQMLVDSLHS